MSGAQSISARRAYGVQRVCRVWGRARSSVYVRRHATPYGAKKRPRLGRCWSSLPSSLRLCRLRCSSSSSRSLAG